MKIPDFCPSGVPIQSSGSKLSQLGLHPGGNHGKMVGETFRMTQSHPHPKPCPTSRLLNSPRGSSPSLSSSFQSLTSPARETRQILVLILILEFLILVSNPDPPGRRLDSQKTLCWFLQKFLCWIWAWLNSAVLSRAAEHRPELMKCPFSIYNLLEHPASVIPLNSNRTVMIKVLCVTQDLWWKCYFSSKGTLKDVVWCYKQVSCW